MRWTTTLSITSWKTTHPDELPMRKGQRLRAQTWGARRRSCALSSHSARVRRRRLARARVTKRRPVRPPPVPCLGRGLTAAWRLTRLDLQCGGKAMLDAQSGRKAHGPDLRHRCGRTDDGTTAMRLDRPPSVRASPLVAAQVPGSAASSSGTTAAPRAPAPCDVSALFGATRRGTTSQGVRPYLIALPCHL